MLILVFGVSCVGKTTIMNHLVEKYHWLFINTYTTRTLRKGEVAKIHVNKTEFENMKQNNNFLCVNEIFGNSYGTPQAEIKNAISSAQYFIMDFPLARREQVFGDFYHISIVLVPENIEQLMQQIKETNRTERTSEILKDYEFHLSYINNIKTQYPTFTVTNYKEQISSTSRQIYDLVQGVNLWQC